VALLSACAVSSAPANLLKNPGFEEVDPATGAPADWKLPALPTGTARLSDQAHSGKRSIELRTASDAPDKNHAVIYQTVAEPVNAGETVILTGFVKADAGGNGFCQFRMYDGAGKYIDDENLLGELTPADNGWTRFAIRCTMQPKTKKLEIGLRNSRGKAKGTVWFDDLSLQKPPEVLENAHLRIELDPLMGGRVRSFILKKTGEDMTLWSGAVGGLAGEILPAHKYPGLVRDVKFDLETVEPGRRIRLRHTSANPEIAGVRVEKEYALDAASPTVDVTVRFTNGGDVPRKLSFRPQNCLVGKRHVFTWPCVDSLRYVNRPAQARALMMQLWVEDLNEGWAAAVDPAASAGLVMLFDRAKVEKAYGFFGEGMDTSEWFYKAFDLAPGATWETTYTLAAVSTPAPVVTAGRELAVGLTPLKFEADGDYTLHLTPLRATKSATVRAKGVDAENRDLQAALTVPLTPPAAAVAALPWKSPRLKRLEFSAEAAGATQLCLLSDMSRRFWEEKGASLPEPPKSMPQYADTVNFFPFGTYLGGIPTYPYRTPPLRREDMKEHTERVVRDYRRHYLNTVKSSIGMFLPNYPPAAPGAERSWYGDLCRAYGLRIIPKMETVRTWDPKPDNPRDDIEVFPENLTREQIIERHFTRRGLDVEAVRKAMADFADLVLAYDISDEPQPRHIPIYMTAQELFRDRIDPAHPAIPVLNMTATQYLPYVPVYYADEYPVRSWDSWGHDPWRVGRNVRNLVMKKTRTPVWALIMSGGGGEYDPPSAGQLRLMTHGIVANGGKGVLYFIMPTLIGWRYNHPQVGLFTLDWWGAYSYMWPLIGDMGRQLTAIGPALLESDLQDDDRFRITDTMKVRYEHLRTRGVFYDGPALTVSVLKPRQGDGVFLVVQNQDPEKTQRGALAIAPEAAAGKTLHDLTALAPAALNDGTKCSVELLPGDARYFYLGPSQDLARVLGQVRAGHCANELALFRIDEQLAAKNGLDTAAPAQQAARAAALRAEGRGAEAHEAALAARAALDKLIAARPDLRGGLDGLAAARARLSELAVLFTEYRDRLIPEAVRQTTGKYQMLEKNPDDPLMQEYMDATADAFRQYMALETRLYSGAARDISPDIAALAARTADLNAKAVPYVKGRTGGK
jgi:hypothetical protein